MPITPKQRERRRNYIGSSDIAAVCGLDPWKNALDVYLQKVYGTDDRGVTEPQRIGNEFEDPLILRAAEEFDLRVQRNQFRAAGIFGANLDAQAYDKGDGRKRFLPIGIEAKTTSSPEGWGEEGSDEVPEYYLLQAQLECYCGPLEVVHMPVLMPEYGRLTVRLYKIERHSGIIEEITRRGEEFWTKNVLPRMAPEDLAPSLEVVKAVRREPDKVIEFPQYSELERRAETDLSEEMLDELEAAKAVMSLIEGWEAAKEAKKGAETLLKQAYARVLTLLGDAEAARLPDGRLLTYLEQRGADKIDRKLLRAKYPEVYGEISTENSYRVARIKKA